jgi:predicted metal-dependent phosphoesterase TrpH
MPGPIDLHTHSSVSDGTETPARLIRSAVAAGLGTVALTDHDSTAGWQEAFGAASGTDLTVIPGMELSTRYEWKSVHLLAYLFDPTNGGIIAETARIRQARLLRAESIVERLSVDYDIDWADVVAQTTEGATVGRPHIADALVAKGHVPNRSAAFASILHPRTGYYQPHYAPDPLAAVKLVRAAGGVPVLAHPGTRDRSGVIPEDRFSQLVDAGLFGLEIDHRENTESGRARLFELAERYGLVITGSSDYHGDGKPNRLAENTTEPEVLERIVAEGTGSAPFRG